MSELEHLPDIMRAALNNVLSKKQEIPKFSKDFTTSIDYIEHQIKSGKLNPDTSYGRRMIRNATEHPHWTLKDYRGHGDPTGETFEYFDGQGRISEGIQFKNRQEESRYASYLNAVKRFQDTGDDSGLKKFKGKTVRDIDGKKHTLVTDTNTLGRLIEFDEMPSGNDIYLH
jgi:hypothetical protein